MLLLNRKTNESITAVHSLALHWSDSLQTDLPHLDMLVSDLPQLGFSHLNLLYLVLPNLGRRKDNFHQVIVVFRVVSHQRHQLPKTYPPSK